MCVCVCICAHVLQVCCPQQFLTLGATPTTTTHLLWQGLFDVLLDAPDEVWLDVLVEGAQDLVVLCHIVPKTPIPLLKLLPRIKRSRHDEVQ